jgi:hypothetical protein
LMPAAMSYLRCMTAGLNAVLGVRGSEARHARRPPWMRIAGPPALPRCPGSRSGRHAREPVRRGGPQQGDG